MTRTRRREMLREYSEIEAQIFALRKRQEELELLIFGSPSKTRDANSATSINRLIKTAKRLKKQTFRAADLFPPGRVRERASVQLAYLLKLGKVVRVEHGLYKLAA